MCQSATPKWRPNAEIAWHHDRYPRHWSTKPARVFSLKTTRLVSAFFLVERNNRLPRIIATPRPPLAIFSFSYPLSWVTNKLSFNCSQLNGYKSTGFFFYSFFYGKVHVFHFFLYCRFSLSRHQNKNRKPFNE